MSYTTGPEGRPDEREADEQASAHGAEHSEHPEHAAPPAGSGLGEGAGGPGEQMPERDAADARMGEPVLVEPALPEDYRYEAASDPAVAEAISRSTADPAEQAGMYTPPASSPSASAPEASAPEAYAEPGYVAPVAPAQQQQYTAAPAAPVAPVYVQAPQPPVERGNRGGGSLIAIIGVIGFAVIYAAILAVLIAAVNAPSTFWPAYLDHLASWRFIFPVAMFLIALILLVVIANRSGWWAYVLGGFLVGVLVWASAALGYWVAPPSGSGVSTWDDVLGVATNPAVLLAGVAAREVTVWVGAWIAHRARRVRARNAAAREEFERQMEAGPGGFGF